MNREFCRPRRTLIAKVVHSTFFAGTALSLLGLVGCSDPVPGTARVGLASELGPGDNGAQACQFSLTSPWLVIGDNQNRVENGASFNGASVAVSCAVKAEGDGFRVAVSAALGAGAGDRAGSVTISGHFTPSGEQTGVVAVFQRDDTGRFEQSDCTVTYGPNQGVASGRVWGRLSCPKLEFPAQNRTCAGSAEFKFENCDQ